MGLDNKAAEQFVKGHICGDCGSNLTVAWGGKFGRQEYIIRCGRDVNHKNFVERKTWKQIVEDNPELRHAFALNVSGNEPEKEI